MTKNTASDRGNFTSMREEMPHRLIWRSFGPEKSGKNHFGFTGPGPVFGQYFDPGGIEGVVEKFSQAPYGPKEIRGITYKFTKNDTSQDAAIELRDRFIEDYEFALVHARTIQWDETELWEVFRFAEFGEASDAPKNYVGLNARYRDLIQQAYDADVNLQLIQKVKEKWTTVKKTNREGRTVDSPAPTGEMEPVGFKEAGYIVQANLRHSWDKERGFVVDVLNCRQNMELAGESFENINFTELAMLVFPDTSEEDWS